jgi:hypothetical protein
MYNKPLVNSTLTDIFFTGVSLVFMDTRSCGAFCYCLYRCDSELPNCMLSCFSSILAHREKGTVLKTNIFVQRCWFTVQYIYTNAVHTMYVCSSPLFKLREIKDAAKLWLNRATPVAFYGFLMVHIIIL